MCVCALTQRYHGQGYPHDERGIDGHIESVGEGEGVVIRVIKVSQREVHHSSCGITQSNLTVLLPWR